MLKKSVIFATSLILGFNITQADDTVKKPVVEEVKKTEVVAKSDKYTLPTKKVEELTKEEVIKAGSYASGVEIYSQYSQNKDFDAKSFILGVEEKIKTPTLVIDIADLQKMGGQMQDFKKEGKPIDPEFQIKFFKLYGTYMADVLPKNGYDAKYFLEGFKEKFTNKDFVIAEEVKTNILQKFQSILAEELKSVGKKFLEDNKKKEGVVTLPSGLQYKIIKKGEGVTGIDGQTVKVHYAGTTIDGKEFDSSIKRGEPFEVALPGQVIKGWQEALKLMNKGSKWQVFIPEDLAYGAQAQGPDIKPFSTLIFEMEVLDISKSVVAPAEPAK